MINKPLNNTSNKMSADAKRYVENFIKRLNAFFDPSFDLKEYSSNLYELLKFEGYDDTKILASRADRKLYAYISDGELRPKFSKAYKDVFDFVLPKVSSVYNKEILEARKNQQTGSMFYNFYISPNGKRHMTTEIIANALLLGVEDKDIDSFIVDYINSVRMKEFSIGQKEARKAELEAFVYRKRMSPEDVRKLAIAAAIFFAICWVSKICYEARQNKEPEKTNKPKYSYSARYTANTNQEYYELYDLENNEYVIGDDDVAKL